VVEGARLESVYRGNSIEGSNPSLSAMFTYLQGGTACPTCEALAIGARNFIATTYSKQLILLRPRHRHALPLLDSHIRTGSIEH